MIVYITTNLKNGKKYIGMDSNNNPTYLGSGSLIIKAIKKYGKENFKKEILEECKSLEELEKRETYWIKYYDAINSKDYYNLADIRKRGKNPFENKTLKEKQEIINKINTKERAEKISISNKGKKRTKTFRELRSKQRLGSKRSNESKLKQSKTLKGRISPSKGKRWDRKLKTPILQFDLNGNFIKEWKGVLIAKKETNIKGISECLNKRSKTSGGYIWKYK